MSKLKFSVPFALAASVLFLGFAASAQAQLAWEKPDLDLKAEAGSNQTTVKFIFKNAGSYPVKIKNIRSCCGCFRAEADKVVYQPGDAGVIEAVFNHAKMSGVQARRLTVVTDDKQHSTQKLVLNLTIP